jgi:DNA polymerase-3 subunit gamma/tau
LDAASNRSVNDMARIRENVQFGPMENRFKTYIVDEAHQLSSDAKDAFLKTLEEPPAGVVFILATTESHAIPVTIASRCQQFDFKRGSIETISREIEHVLGLESVEMSADAIGAIARSAEGSYRDALSLLEQVLAYKRTGVNASDVAEVLGAVDAQVVAQVVEMIAHSDAARAFALAERVFADGKDTRQFLKTIAARFRDLLYVSVGAKAAAESGVVGDPESLTAQAKSFSPAQLLRAMEVLAEAERETKFVTQHRLLLEMTLLRLIDLPGAPAVASGAAAPEPAKPAPSTPRTPIPRPVEQPHVDPLPTPAVLAARKPAPAATEAPLAPGDQIEFLRTHWQQVINHMQARSPGGLRVISNAFPLRQEGSTIILGFNSKASLDMIEGAARRQLIEEVVCKVLRADTGAFKVRGVLNSSKASTGAPLSVPVAPVPAPAAQPSAEAESPLLDEVISIFGGNIVDD